MDKIKGTRVCTLILPYICRFLCHFAECEIEINLVCVLKSQQIQQTLDTHVVNKVFVINEGLGCELNTHSWS